MILAAGRVGSAACALAFLALACARPDPAHARTPDPASEPTPDGRALYETHCLTCHQADGGGVPNFQPAIIDSPWLDGTTPPEDLGRLALYGLASGAWDNVMAGVSDVRDAEMAALLTYARKAFTTPTPGAAAITPETIAAARKQGPLPGAPGGF